MLIPKPLTNFDFDSDIESLDEDIVLLDTDEDYVDKHTRIPHLIHQSELNDLVRDLNLTKNQAEILGSRLQEWNLLSDETRISVFRTRQKNFSCYFELQDALCYCSNIDSLMNELGVQHCPEEWRLSIDSSKSSLKAVLLHNGNDYPSVPIGHSVHMRESFENMVFLLDHIKYLQYNWNICCDLKVIGLLMGMQSGYTKYCCFLCEWDSRARNCTT